MTKSVAIHFASAAVSVMASFAVGVNPESSSESAQNAFVSVRADGVRIENGRDFSVTGSAVRVLANPGWRLLTPSDVNLDGASPAVYRVVDYSRENDADGNIDLVETETDDVHVEPPEITAQASCGGLYVIGYPETNIEVSVTFTASLKKAGSHRVTARTYKNGELTSTDGPNDVGTAPDVWKWQWHAGPYSGSSNSRTFTTNLVFKPGRYDVSGRVTASLGTCCECSAEADAETDLLVSLLTVECNPWIGQDRTGDPDDPYESPKVTASARLEPDVLGVSGVEWEYGGDMTCDEFHPDAWTATLWSTQRDAHSKSHLGDMLTATVLGASATTNFTVVKVDVIVDGAGESAEESEGGLTPFVADDNGRMTETGTNALVSVSFACEPKNLPTNEVVSVRCCGAGELYEITPKGEYKHIETAEYPACDVSFRRFGLHGHNVCESANEGDAAICHKSSGSEDKAIYTCFSLKFVTPAGDPIASPSDCGEGQNEFTFSKGQLIMGLSAQVTPADLAPIIKKYCAFDVDEIGISKITWEQNKYACAVDANDGKLVANVVFDGMPVHNSDFGRKNARLFFKGREMDRSSYEVFFSADECDHPEDAKDSTINGVKSPNWYYYWREGNVVNGLDAFKYAKSTKTGVVEFGYYDTTNNVLVICQNAVHMQIEQIVSGFVLRHDEGLQSDKDALTNPDFFDFSPSLDQALSLEHVCLEIGTHGAGVRAVAGTIKHELMHKNIHSHNQSTNLLRAQYIEMDDEKLLVFTDERDMDGDYIDDIGELNGVFNVRSMPKDNPDTYGLASLYDQSYSDYGDEDVRARLAERVGIDEAYKPLEDWANPGCQSKNRRGPNPYVK